MNKIKQGGKNSLHLVLFLSLMVFGIGCISYAVINIKSQSGDFVYASTSGNSVPTTAQVINKLGNSSDDRLESVPLNTKSQSNNKTIYPKDPVEGENIGSLTIPALNRKLPIIQGTNEKELNKGVGHFIKSVLPGEEDNCVISGHRDTAFRQIGELKLGDKLIVQTWAGTFIYEINGTRIVHQDDKTVIVPIDHAVLTLTTCYPFNFIGNAPDRYIVSATLVKNN